MSNYILEEIMKLPVQNESKDQDPKYDFYQYGSGTDEFAFNPPNTLDFAFKVIEELRKQGIKISIFSHYDMHFEVGFWPSGQGNKASYKDGTLETLVETIYELAEKVHREVNEK